jgi:hypothetical protein
LYSLVVTHIYYRQGEREGGGREREREREGGGREGGRERESRYYKPLT